MTNGRWRFFIDRGGTFTDCIGIDPHTGTRHVLKLLSTDDAPLQAMRVLQKLGPDSPLPPCELRLGTTLATNALLERRGEASALFITRGFRDLLTIGDQSRPDLFALDLEQPRPLPTRVLEIDARLDAQGAVRSAPDLQTLDEDCRRLRSQGIDAVALVVLHAYANPTFELELAERIRRHGFRIVVASSEVSTTPGLLARTDTAVVDAYTTPPLARYLEHLRTRLPGSTVSVMQSSGGLADASRFRGKDAVLSGPAGGAVACAEIGRRLGLPQLIGFDMGGTSTDVLRWGGSLEREHETALAGVRIRTPMIAIHTVAAGGGSLCRFDGLRFTVGPHSAAAEPGPLCYGHPDAREPALTDVAATLGRLPPDRFPFPLDLPRARAGVAGLAQTAGMSVEATAEGLLSIAVENMARAIRTVTVARGHDVREHAMVVFGGAGGQYGCALARTLGIRTLVLHPLGGVLSAWGIGRAAQSWHGERDGGGRPLQQNILDELGAHFETMREEGDGALGAASRARRTVALRYAGTQTTLELPWATAPALASAFAQRHADQFGYERPEHPIEVAALRLELRIETGDDPPRVTEPGHAVPAGRSRLHHDGVWIDAPRFDRERLPAELDGPALILESTGTLVVEPGWRVRRRPDDILVLEDTQPESGRRVGTQSDPVALEVMGGRFMAIAEQMGEVLRRTSVSTNIRERLDFSCAVFDRHGGLVANAPHMPVHLGAMGASVEAIAAQHPNPSPGDVFATNDPTAGGSHLPDITVVTPVFDGDDVAFYVASRGHHADVGGVSPGSMPPHATRLDEEGVIFRGTRIVHGGRFDAARVRKVLGSGPHPARRPTENIADLQAQTAANQTGVTLLEALCGEVGITVVHAHMRHVQAHAAHAVRQAIAKLPFEHASFEDVSDDGLRISVTLRREAGHLHVDFSGSSGCGEHNLHAPRAVTVAAVLYVLRALVGEPIPLNRGCLEPITLTVPRPSLLDPASNCAVAGGNVETAQRVVDVLLGAVGRKAASQGTMNNLTFGDDTFGYYETIAGGDGATASSPGRDGVHTHMTNTRITDPETLELRFPVRLERFALRSGSGGVGRHRGGDGVLREFTLLRPLQVSMLSDRRRSVPFGLAGGAPGAAGKTLIDGTPHGGRFSEALPAGTTIRIETPGAGGFGPPRDPPEDP
ncbi:MAG: hydantoinase B/oxoprolinase family protein [Nannocystaceae bacterium]|nr:hydantoinase B/oxoprolinase family protein [Nannocystaceae bacterium]